MNQTEAFRETVAMAVAAGMPELPGSELGLAHLRSMQERILPEFSSSKLGRWLGWAQCALVAANVGVTLEDVKRLNLKWSGDGQVSGKESLASDKDGNVLIPRSELERLRREKDELRAEVERLQGQEMFWKGSAASNVEWVDKERTRAGDLADQLEAERRRNLDLQAVAASHALSLTSELNRRREAERRLAELRVSLPGSSPCPGKDADAGAASCFSGDALEIGTPVTKISGYPFPGEIRAAFTNRAGDLRYVVEATGIEITEALLRKVTDHIEGGTDASADVSARLARLILGTVTSGQYEGMLHIFSPAQIAPASEQTG